MMVAPYCPSMVPNTPPPRSMRSTIAAVEGLANRTAVPVTAPTVPDREGFTIGFAAGIFTAAALAATGWLMVYLTMHEVSPWVAAMVVLALVYVALLLVDRMFSTAKGRDTITPLPIRTGRDQSGD